jgi:hypothetical protein
MTSEAMTGNLVRVYHDDIIEVALSSRPGFEHIGIRWLDPQPALGKSGELVPMTNIMGGATDWFLLPTSLGTAVGKKLVGQSVAGLSGFDDEGLKSLIRWLVELQELHDAMCY